MNDKISVIISARNESPQIVWTVYSIAQDLETFTDDWEIIIVDNGSQDDTSDYLKSRGLYTTGRVKILMDPVMGNVSARNKGVDIAKGDYIFFADAHMVIKRGSFQAMVEALKEYPNAIVHPGVDWLGSYPEQPCYQYTLLLGEKFWGRWNRIKISDKPFAIPLCGHCCLGVRKDLFQAWGGYNKFFRAYGGGENYLNIKWWLFGGIVLSVPKAVVWHSRFKRGYVYFGHDLIHNQMLSAYTVAGEKWAERVLITYLDKGGTNEEFVKELYRQALAEGASDRRYVLENQQISFNDILREPPWDSWNDKVHGWHKSYIVKFEDWTERLKDPRAIEYYKNSKFQMEE